MERVTKITQERAKGGKSIGALSMAINDTPNEPRGPAFEPRTSTGAVTSPTQTAAGSNSSEVSSVSNYGYFTASVEDEVIPWSDTPQVSRFGPISRRGTSITRPSKPSQATAAMDDETNPTAVVRHSKQMSKQLPPTASLILQVKICTYVYSVNSVSTRLCKEHCYKKKAASVGQNGRLSASCNFFSL
jgi:hypothetical protein